MATKFSRFYYATTYYNKNYLKILKWIFESKEDTNFTYDLTDDNKLVLAQFISHVTNSDLKDVIEYIAELEQDKRLQNHIATETKKSKFGYKADSNSLFGRRIGWYALIRAMKPKVVIETGVDKGLGSVVITAALRKNSSEGVEGRYYGTDIDPKAGYLLSGEYAEFGEILYGDSIESLKVFNHTIDLFINDSDHSTEYEGNEYKVIKSKLTEKSIIVSDNAHCSPELSRFSKEENRNFLFYKEEPKDHWYPGSGIGISWAKL